MEDFVSPKRAEWEIYLLLNGRSFEELQHWGVKILQSPVNKVVLAKMLS